MEPPLENIDSDRPQTTVDPRNKLNDLSASEWISRTVSVFTQKGLGKTSNDAKIERQHPAPFSFQDISRFVEFFTKRGETVFDPFCGVGSTLKASALLGRRSIGVELNQKYVELTHERMQTEIDSKSLNSIDYHVLCGDIRNVINSIEENSVDMIVTSPPYWGILNKVDHKAKQERLANGYDYNYGTHNDDLARIERYEDFISTLARSFDGMNRVLCPNRYMVIIVGDFRNKQKYYMFHSDLANEIEGYGKFTLKGITIIYQKFKRVFPYGYPYAYVPNIHHQYAMIFQNNG